METPQTPPQNLSQRSRWSSQSDIILKGYQFQELTRLADLFRPFVQAVDQALQQNIQTGVITSEWVDENENVIEPELVNQAMKLVQEKKIPVLEN